MQLHSSNGLPKLRANDDWLRQRQGLVLPVRSPSTPEAKQYFFSKMKEYALAASDSGNSKIDILALCREWNDTADGKFRCYITVEILETYMKTWEKVNNIHASQELIGQHLDILKDSRAIFRASDMEFPTFIASDTMPSIPLAPQGRITDLSGNTPASVSTQLSISHPPTAPPSQGYLST